MIKYIAGWTVCQRWCCAGSCGGKNEPVCLSGDACQCGLEEKNGKCKDTKIGCTDIPAESTTINSANTAEAGVISQSFNGVSEVFDELQHVT